jgi:hypothetical protein
MKKFVFILLTILFLVNATHAHAKTAGSSARLAFVNINLQKEDNRTLTLRNFLMQYDSPLAGHSHKFISEADKNGLDWKLVASIAGVESYFGHMIPPYSYNGWGYGVYGTNVRRFDSWDDGITTVSQALRRDYINNWGATNVYEIGSFYAADPLWASKVTHFMNLLEKYEADSSRKSISISI